MTLNRSAQYPGMLYIGLRVVKMGKSSLTYECGIFQAGSDTVKAVGGQVSHAPYFSNDSLTME